MRVVLPEQELYFDVDIQGELNQWWYKVYVPGTFNKHYSGQSLALAILDNRVQHDWRAPFANVRYGLAVGDDAKLEGPTGLWANVAGKARFALRNGCDSRVAEQKPWLIEPGDFPFPGWLRGFYDWDAGASGLLKESDEQVVTDVLTKLCRLREDAASRYVEACSGRAPGDGPSVKYLLADGWRLDGTFVLVPPPGSGAHPGIPDPDFT